MTVKVVFYAFCWWDTILQATFRKPNGSRKLLTALGNGFSVLQHRVVVRITLWAFNQSMNSELRSTEIIAVYILFSLIAIPASRQFRKSFSVRKLLFHLVNLKKFPDTNVHSLFLTRARPEYSTSHDVRSNAPFCLNSYPGLHFLVGNRHTSKQQTFCRIVQVRVLMLWILR